MGIKIQDVAYVRFSAPDLDEMEAFLTEFGMVRAERSGNALYVRGLDSTALNVIAHGECSGAWRQFKVPLAPGTYVVELGGHWESSAGAVRFAPSRTTVEVKAGQWVKLAPPRPLAPVP